MNLYKIDLDALKKALYSDIVKSDEYLYVVEVGDDNNRTFVHVYKRYDDYNAAVADFYAMLKDNWCVQLRAYGGFRDKEYYNSGRYDILAEYDENKADIWYNKAYAPK